MSTSRTARRVLQFCHGYDGPFLDCARQYAALFDGTDYQVTTVFLTGKKDQQVADKCQSAEVLFMEYSSANIRGLKLKAIRELRQIARERDFSFCIAHRSKPTYIACLATNLPVIGVHHAFGDFERLGRKLFARVFRSRLHLLAVSDAVREDIRSCLPGWPHERIQTLHNRIDVEAVSDALVSRGEARRTLKLPDNAWVVGNVGRLHPDKDQATLVEGFAKALPALPPQAVLVIMGVGRLESKLKALVQSLEIEDRVVFTGQVPDARQYFKAFDVFALTSDHEPFGMVLLEAMAAGNALICSDCGGGPEVVGDIGCLFPFGDATSLAATLLRCAGYDAEQLAMLGQQANERLTLLFSDTAAQRRFWQLPVTAPYK
ncbi:MAG: glycosyltransferase [Halopseudomonas sabulinigri]